MLALKTSAHPAPSLGLRRSHTCTSALSASNKLFPRQGSTRQASLARQFTKAPTTRMRASSASSASLSLDDAGNVEGEEEEVQPPQPPLPPSPRLALPLAWRALEAALWPELVITWFSAKKREVTAYLALSRPWNLLPSITMVFAGAAAAAAAAATATARTTTGGGLSPISSSSAAAAAAAAAALSVFANARVWHAALSTAAIALGSMAVNDYFDVPSDRVNAPSKPLPSGAVSADGALLFGGALYLSALVAAAWLEPRELRLLVAGSAAVTLAYTPVLKKIAVAKTAAVAGVIALSPAAGALAVSAAPGSSTSAALASVSPACLLAFFAVCGRELLMDAADARGDGAAGVATLPVLVGRGATLLVATTLEVLAVGVLLARVAAAFRASSSLLIPAASAVALGCALVLPVARAARAALALGRLRKEQKKGKKSSSSAASSLREEAAAEAALSAAISKSVNTMMKPIALAVVAALVLG